MLGVLIFTLISLMLSSLIVLLNICLFKRKTKKDKLIQLLPGYNCGSCGYGSCSGMSEELLKNKDAINKCRFIQNKEEILKFLGE